MREYDRWDTELDLLRAFRFAWVNFALAHATGDPDLIGRCRRALLAAHHAVDDFNIGTLRGEDESAMLG